MSDEFNSPMPGGPPAPVPPVMQTEPPAKKGPARIVGFVIALGVLAIVTGIVVAIALFVFGGEPSDDIEVRVGGSETAAAAQSGTTQPTTAATGEASPPVANSEVFTFRDIFEPLLKPVPSQTTTDGTNGTDDTGGDDDATPTASDTLYLNDIVTEDGELKAVLELDGETYTLGPGEGIEGTPWEVLRITDTQVTMLYGDTQVTLTIGQGITK